MEEKGRKFDAEKLRWDLLDLGLVEEIVKILTFGAQKYAPNNWQKVDNAEDRYYSALLRHLVEYRKGNKIDKESGISHLSHAACNIMFLIYFDKHGEEVKSV